MGSAQSSYATNNNDIHSSTKKNWSSKSRSVRGRKSINHGTNTNHPKLASIGSAPHGMRASIVSIPSEQLDITSAESVHSDDVVDARDTNTAKALVALCSDDDDTTSTTDGESNHL